MKADGVRHADRTIRVAGAGHVQSRGVRGGGIVNMDEAAQAIGHAVERAERAAQSPVSGVVVTTAIGQMASHRVQARGGVGQVAAEVVAHGVSERGLVDRRVGGGRGGRRLGDGAGGHVQRQAGGAHQAGLGHRVFPYGTGEQPRRARS